jgi:hypothetical protein
MSIAAEKLPLPHRDVRKKKLPLRCRDGFQKNVRNFTATTVLDQKYWYWAIRFIQSQAVSLVNTETLSNSCTFSMSSEKILLLPR